MTINRRIALSRLAILAGTPVHALAQLQQQRPLKIILGFPPGGGADFAARMLQGPLARELGQTVIIDYRPGAGGTIGANAVAKSDPDGQTVLVTTAGAVSLAPALIKNLPFEPVRDLAPVGRIVTSPTVFVTGVSTAANDMREMLAQAKASGSVLTVASSGNGSIPHMAIELLSASSGAQLTHIPYKGAGPALTDVIGGQVQAFVADLSVVLPHIKSGKLKAVGIAGHTRISQQPAVPTLEEQGFANTHAENWYAMFAASKTPLLSIERLASALAKVVRDPAVAAQFQASGSIPTPSSPADLAVLLRTEVTRWGKLVVERQIKGD